MVVWAVVYSVQDGGGGVVGIYSNPAAAEEHLDAMESDPDRDPLTRYYVEDFEVETEFVNYREVR